MISVTLADNIGSAKRLIKKINSEFNIPILLGGQAITKYDLKEKKDIEKIFAMYGRLNNDVDGQGIGLYLAKKIVNATGGTILLESEPGVGSKFMIYLKIEAERPKGVIV